MADAGTFRCELFTAEKPVARLDATSVILPANDGLLGVLPGRAAVVAVLGSGTLLVRSGGQDAWYDLSGGFAWMKDNVLTVLAERCGPSQERTAKWVQNKPTT